jgi:hypothetical protein
MEIEFSSKAIEDLTFGKNPGIKVYNINNQKIKTTISAINKKPPRRSRRKRNIKRS